MSVEEQISELIDKYEGLDVRHLQRYLSIVLQGCNVLCP